VPIQHGVFWELFIDFVPFLSVILEAFPRPSWTRDAGCTYVGPFPQIGARG
jgi:hypothetical protein